MNNELEVLEEKINYKFKDIKKLRIALTHKSYAYEYTTEAMTEYNERIEFLGDAILEHVISDYLYNNENKYSEGEMSKLRASIVCETSLSIAMKNIGAHNFIRLGKGEIKTDGKHKDAIIADAFEAIVGAVYLDSGYEEAKKVIFRLLNRQIEQILSGKIINSDYKTALQEELQKNGTVKIEYNLIKETGPEHDKSFFMEVLLNGKKIGEGYGKNKKQAEQSAAKDALNKKGWN